MSYLIRIELGLGQYYEEIRSTPEGRDACVRAALEAHPEYRVSVGEIPGPDESGVMPRIFTITMQDAVLPRDPDRGEPGDLAAAATLRDSLRVELTR